MDGRSYTLIVSLALAGTAFAGCIEAPEWLNTNSAEISAFEARGAADEAALAWSEDAKLAGVMAFELASTPDPRIDSDPDPGNGLAPAWWFVYCDVEEEAEKAEARAGGSESAGEAKAEAAMAPMVKAFKVHADGTVTSEEDAEDMAMGIDHDMAEAIGAWTIDSGDALAIAKGDETFAKVAQGYNASLVEGVASHEGVTSWWVSAMSQEGFVVALVDAASGELLAVTDLDMDFEMPGFEWGAANPELAGTPVWLEGEGTAMAGEEPVETPFETTSPVWGMVSFTYSTSQPMDGLHWAILDEEGEIVAVDHLGGWRGGEGEYESKIEIEDAGAYTLSIGYMSSFPGFDFVPLPTGGSVDYTYTVDLMPGEMPDEDEEQHH